MTGLPNGRQLPSLLDDLSALAPGSELWIVDPGGRILAASAGAGAAPACGSLLGRLGDLSGVWREGECVVAPIRLERRVMGALVARGRELAAQPAVAERLARLLGRLAVAGREGMLEPTLDGEGEDEFVSAVAHQLKMPVTAIKGFASLLLQDAAGPLNLKQRDYLRIIESSVDRMSALIDDLLELANLESGRRSLTPRVVNLPDLVQGVVGSFEGLALERGHQFVCQTREGLPPAWGDPEALRQVLSILLSNACQYTPNGGRIEVRIEELPAGTEGGQRLVVAVSDSGIGIGEEDLGRVFHPFFRADAPLVRDTAGSGLGLAIAKQLMERLQGEIWFASALGRGSTFSLSVPAASPEQLARSPVEPAVPDP